MKLEPVAVIELKNCIGLRFDNGQVELLSNPVWRKFEGRWCWVALANAYGMLCLIEVRVEVKVIVKPK